jgi:hypothetical protein
VSSDREYTIWASSFVSNRTRKGMVSLRWKDNEVQLSTDEARDLATNIARAAEASETDEMCMALMGDEVGIHLIRLMRDYREVKLGIQKAEWTPAEIAQKLKGGAMPPTT